MKIPRGNCLLLLVTFVASVRPSAGVEQRTLSYAVQEEGLGSLIATLPRDLGIADATHTSFAMLEVNPVSVRDQLEFQGTELVAVEPVDREDLCGARPHCGIIIDAIALEAGRLTHQLTLNISLLDINDNSPSFSEMSPFAITLPQNAHISYSVELPIATDNDLPPNGVKSYQVIPEEGMEFRGVLVVEKSTPTGGKVPYLTVVESLSQVTQTTFTLKLSAKDGGTPSLTGEIDLLIQVKEANVHTPQFVESTLELTVPEDTEPGASIGKLIARDADSGISGNISYSFGNDRAVSPDEVLIIDPVSGNIQLKSSLDHEAQTSYSFLVRARDRGAPPKMTERYLNVYVIDVNDCSPVITFNSHLANKSRSVSTEGRLVSIYVEENVSRGTFLGFVDVSDADSGENGRVECSISSETAIFELASIRPHYYQVLLLDKLDYEKQSLYELQIVCSDVGQVPRTSQLPLNLVVVDLNDNTPVFAQPLYTIRVEENDPRKFAALRVQATDQDSGPNQAIRYSIEDMATGYLQIDPAEGIIETTGYPFDHEKYRELVFQVYATDGGEPARTGSAVVNITIEDENDEAAEFTRSHFTLYVQENEAPGASAGYVRAVDTDSPPFDQFDYEMSYTSDEMLSFELHTQTGEITTRRTLDRESKKAYHLRVSTRNRHPPHHTRDVEVTVYVNDTNDNDPEVFYPQKANFTVYVRPENFHQTLVAQIQASDRDEGKNAALEYSLTSRGDSQLFTIDKKSGVIVVREQIDVKLEDWFYVEVRIQDGGQPVRSISTSIIVRVSDRIPVPVPEKPTEAAGVESAGILAVSWLHVAVVAVVILLIVAMLTVITCLLVRRRRRTLASNKSTSSFRPAKGDFTTFTLPSDRSENTMSWDRSQNNYTRMPPPPYKRTTSRKSTMTMTDNHSINSELSGADDEVPELPSHRRPSRMAGGGRRPRYDSRSSQTDGDDLEWLYKPRDATLDYKWDSNGSIEGATPEEIQPLAKSDAQAMRPVQPRLRTLSGGNYGHAIYPRSPMAMLGPNYTHFFADPPNMDPEPIERTESQVSFGTFKPDGQRSNIYASLTRYRETQPVQPTIDVATLRTPDEDDDDVFGPDPPLPPQQQTSHLSEISEENLTSASFDATPSFPPVLKEENLEFVKFLDNSTNGAFELQAPPSGKRKKSKAIVDEAVEEETTPLMGDEKQDSPEHNSPSQDTSDGTSEASASPNVDQNANIRNSCTPANIRNSCTPDLLEHAQSVHNEIRDNHENDAKENILKDNVPLYAKPNKPKGAGVTSSNRMAGNSGAPPSNRAKGATGGATSNRMTGKTKAKEVDV